MKSVREQKLSTLKPGFQQNVNSKNVLYLTTDEKEINVLPLTGLLDKDKEKSMLVNAIDTGRLGGSLLFYGPDGSGKSSLAFWLAQVLNCENSKNDLPCGSCASCRKIETLTHPDVYWVFPVPGGFYKSGRPDDTKFAEVFEAKRNTPWISAGFDEKAEHHLAAMQRVRADAAKRPYEGRYKIFVITHADRLRQEAANSFLKLLEEPQPQVVLILCSDRPRALIPTILSRCLRLRVSRPSRQTQLDILESRLGVNRPEAEKLFTTAEGNLTQAITLTGAEQEFDAGHWAEKCIQSALAGSTDSILDILEDRSGPAWNRGHFERFCDNLAQIVRDILAMKLTGDAGRTLHGETEISEQISARIQSTADARLLSELLRKLIDIKPALARNVNLKLMGWSLINEIREAAGDASRDSRNSI